MPKAQPQEHMAGKILAAVAGSTEGSAESGGSAGSGDHHCRGGSKDCAHGLLLSSINQQAY